MDKKASQLLNDSINRRMQQHVQRNRNVKQILLVGPKSSGKSTLFRAVASLHDISIDPTENHALFIQTWCYQQALHLCASIDDQRNILKLQQLSVQNASDLPHIAVIISSLWKKQRVATFMHFHMGDQRKVPDNLDYFLHDIDRIMSDDYEATEEDICRCRFDADALRTIQYGADGRHYEWIDLSASLQHVFTKRLYMFDGLKEHIFVAPLSDYCVQTANGDNALAEHVKLFARWVNHRAVRRVETVLFLNKEDIFRKQLQIGLPFARFRDDEYIKQVLEHSANAQSFDIPFVDPVFETIVPCYIRTDSQIPFDRIPIEIIHLIQQYVRMHDPFGDDETLFQEYCKYAVDCVKEAFITQNQQKHRVIFCHVTCAVDKDLVQYVFWDCQAILIRSGLAFGGGLLV